MTLSNPLKHYYENNIRTALFLLLVFVLPFFHKFSNVAIGVLFLVSIVEIVRKKEFPRFEMFWFLPALFLYYVLSELLSGGLWSSVEKRILLIAIPLLFAINPSFYDQSLRKKIYFSFILGNLSAVIICFVRATIRSIEVIDGHWRFNAIIDQTDSEFLTSSIMGGNYYFGYEFSYFLPTPTYFGIFIVYAQYLIFALARSEEFKRKKRRLVICYLFFLLTLFLLSSKAAIISSLFLSVYVAYYVLSTLPMSSFARITIISGIIVVSGLFLFFNPRVQAFREIVQKGEIINPNARFGDDLRILSWDASLEIIKDNWLIGVGEGKKESRLAEVYNKKGYNYPAERLLNSHNQYLDFLVGGGLLGLGLFLTGLIQLLIRGIREGNKPLLAFLLLFSFNALFENILSRHAGILFFAVFVSVLAGTRKKPDIIHPAA